MKRLFTVAELQELGAPYDMDADFFVEDTQHDVRRWYEVRRLVFYDTEGFAWAVLYERGLTEIQEDHDTWPSDPVEAVGVVAVTTSITTWEEAPE